MNYDNSNKEKSTFLLQGTISELMVENNNVSFKIYGTEGFSIKRGGQTYNILSSDKNLAISSTTPAFIIFQDIVFETSESNIPLLSASITSGFKLTLIIEASNNDIIKNHPLTVKSIKISNN